MTIAKLKLDQSANLDFQIQISGASGLSDSRFVIEGEKYSISIPCKRTDEGVRAELSPFKGVLPAGTYSAKLEVILENKIYTPVSDTITLEQNVEILAKPVVVESNGPAVSVGIVKVENVINEELLRRTQAASVIAKSLGYIPEKHETPEQTIARALESRESVTTSEMKTLKEMLALAESIGLRHDSTHIPDLVEEKENSIQDDLDALDKDIDSIDDWDDIIDAYDPDELAIVDADSGEVVDDQLDESFELNEVLSRAERIKARMRFAKTAAKRERKLVLALHRHSNAATLNHRARRLAVKMLEKKLSRGKQNLSVAEKERIEKIVQSRSALITKMTRKLAQKVKQIEQNRLSHNSYTQGA